MRGHDRPSEGLPPLWCVEPDLERDGDSRQHATQYNDLEHGRRPWPFGPDESAGGRVHRESAGHCARGHRRALRIVSTKGEG